MKKAYYFIILLFSLSLFSSCEKDKFEERDIAGLWKQESITVDGVPATLTPEEASCKLLIEPNGIYRSYHTTFKNYNKGNGPVSFYGTWSITDGEWVNFTVDKWKMIAALSSDSNKVSLAYKSGAPTVIDTVVTVQKQWKKFHIQTRFTILKLSGNEMELRLKTFVAEKKYAFLFAPSPSDFIEVVLNKGTASESSTYLPKLVTDQRYWEITKEYQTLSTYVFKFRKESY